VDLATVWKGLYIIIASSSACIFSWERSRLECDGEVENMGNPFLEMDLNGHEPAAAHARVSMTRYRACLTV